MGRLPGTITELDFVGIPSQDPERSRAFYVDTLGLRPDEQGRFEFWVGTTCFADPDGNHLMLHHRYAPRT